MSFVSVGQNGYSYIMVSSLRPPPGKVITLTTSIYIAGVQIEVGAFATSYITIDASAVTRAADFASIEGNDFSSLYNPMEGTFARGSISNNVYYPHYPSLHSNRK